LASIGGERKREVLYTMPLKKNALGPSEAACIEQYKVVSKEDGGWLVTLFVTTPKVRCHLSEPVLMAYTPAGFNMHCRHHSREN